MLPRHLAEHALAAAAEAAGLTPGETAATIRSGIEYGIRASSTEGAAA
jgi:hypothetical protein